MPREAEHVQGVMKLELVKANNLATVRENYYDFSGQTRWEESSPLGHLGLQPSRSAYVYKVGLYLSGKADPLCREYRLDGFPIL